MGIYIVYILQSHVSQKRYYIGVTANLASRIAKHNRGGNKSTKMYKPWKVVYFEKYESKEKAYKREYYLKHPEGYLEKKSIIKNLV